MQVFLKKMLNDIWMEFMMYFIHKYGYSGIIIILCV